MKTGANNFSRFQKNVQRNIFFDSPLKNYGWAVLSILAVTVFGKALTPYLDLTNIVLIYFLPVLVSAVRWGRGPAFLSSFLGVLDLQFFLCPADIYIRGGGHTASSLPLSFSFRGPCYQHDSDKTER